MNITDEYIIDAIKGQGLLSDELYSKVVTEVDSMRFSMISLAQQFQGRQAVFDIKYDIPLCNNRRRLSEKSRRLGTFQL